MPKVFANAFTNRPIFDLIAPMTMPIGIFARTFSRPTLGELFDVIAGHRIESVQFNFSCAGLPTLPEQIDPELTERICREIGKRNLNLAAVSGTFNLIHPDKRARQDGLRRLRVLAAACAGMHAPIITLCTGTRDADNMWRRHAGNDSPDAWADLLDGMGEAVSIAETNDVVLGVEPEPGNVVSSARKARRLLDELKSPRLKIVMDAANLIEPENLPQMRKVLDEAFELLGGDIAIAHAKDVKMNGSLKHVAAGKGLLDYDHYMSLLRQIGFSGSLILHELQESEVESSVAVVRAKLESTSGKY